MSLEPSGLRLPPRDIVPPRSIARSVFRILGPIVVIVVVLLVVVARNPAAVIGGAIAVVILVLIVVVEVPWMLRNQEIWREALTSRLPDGGFYSGRAALYPPRGAKGLAASGIIVFDESGVRFTPRKEGAMATNCDWSAISRMQLGPAPGKIGVGRLVMRLTDGDRRTFDVPNFGAMAVILQKHP